MDTSSGNHRYTRVAVALHWLLALAIVCAFAVGVVMSDMKLSPTRIRLFNWHKWAGVTILLASALRLAWRLRHRPPPPAVANGLQRHAAEWAHRLLYLLFFLVPIVGWAHSSAAGFPVVWFGIVPLPDFVAVDKALAKSLAELHALLAYSMAALVALHTAAAIKHHFVDRDGVMLRMLPARGD